MENTKKVILLIDFSESYGRDLLKGIAKYSNLNGPWIFCRMPLSYREKFGVNGIIEWAKEWNADGIIAQLNNSDDIHQLIDTGIPIIAQDFKERFESIPNITGKYKEAGQMAAEHFLSKGFENFAFYGFDDRVWSRERLEGFKDGVKKNGHTVSVFEEGSSISRDLWYYKQSPLSNWLLTLKKPTALFACDDNQGNNVIQAAKVAGINIPEELAVLGNDNDQTVCEMSDPSLSSIAMDVVKGGYESGALLSKLMDGDESEIKDIIVEPTHIVSRHSTNILAMQDIEVAKALRYIRNNRNEIIGVNDVLKIVSLSRRAIEKRFVKALKRTIYQEIQLSKLEHICKKLLETDNSIFNIAVETGFGDSKNLSRYFKKIKGTTPSEFRKIHREY
ncbi:AraC family transcriptional regulator [Lutibacter citreus]|uniref:AraC family transcriptional regulator n=1 Tax=Lutibacter citreus TaxID=2138210 RepID=UPI000DBE4C61|nr:DNA-binding transcriptional regulator [Lutibacter citreus]